jgi:hypothetical protein
MSLRPIRPLPAHGRKGDATAMNRPHASQFSGDLALGQIESPEVDPQSASESGLI